MRNGLDMDEPAIVASADASPSRGRAAGDHGFVHIRRAGAAA
ncbi:hypothetical protein [Xanthomonas sacchari]|nr:hypothetical protein [Xanthomonas sacchari]